MEEYIRLVWEADHWKTLYGQALLEIEKLQAQVKELEAEKKKLRKRTFGRKSETKKSRKKRDPSSTGNPRGQQAGSQGHGRRDYGHLPAKEEVHGLHPDECHCPKCGLPFEEFPGTEDSETIEIEVKAHRRVIKRKRYKPACKCGAVPGVVTAPAPPKLIPRGIIGISIWVMVLLDKFLFLRPTYRLLDDLATHGLPIAQGTLTDGLRTIAPLFIPIYEALIARNLKEGFWHADETRWSVFVAMEGKVGYRWYMWVFSGRETVVFRLDTTRSSKVPNAHFGEDAQGIMEVDRYSAYKAMPIVKNGQVLLAFCWAHVRRDFLDVATGYPEEKAWALGWVEKIDTLFRLNALRLEALDQPEEFAQRDRDLRDAVDRMKQELDEELKALQEGRKFEKPSAPEKALKSLENHWSGLTLFVDHPEVPMDNNEAERKMRKPAVARKNFYGSGSLWSGQLAAMLFSIFHTLALWMLNPRLWLTAYLQACSTNGGKAPEDIQGFLPWEMSEEQRRGFPMEPAITPD